MEERREDMNMSDANSIMAPLLIISRDNRFNEKREHPLTVLKAYYSFL